MTKGTAARLAVLSADHRRRTIGLFDRGAMLQTRVPRDRACRFPRIQPTPRAVAWTLILLAWTGWFAPLSFGDGTADAASPASSIQTLSFDLKTHTVTGALPFDEPFHIKATGINGATVGGRVRFAPVARGKKCGPSGVDPEVSAALQRMVPVEGFVSTGGTSPEFFALSKDEFLSPNSLQCFVFELDEKVPSEFHTAMRAKYELLATELQDKASLAPRDFDDIRAELRNELRALASARRMNVILPKESVLVPGAASPQAKRVFERNFVDVLSAQSNKVTQMDSFCQDRAAAIDALAVLQTGSFGDVLKKMHENRLANPAVGTLIAANTPAFQDLLGDRLSKKLRGDTDCSAANGRAPVKALDILMLMKSADLAGHEAELDLLVAQLVAMKGMFESLLADNAKLATAIGADSSRVRRDIERLVPATDRFRSAKTQLQEVKVILDARDAALDRIANRDDFLQLNDVSLVGSTIVPLAERAKLYISADLGMAAAWDIQKSFGYAGVNFSTRAINKNAPLEWRPSDLDWWRKRLSGMVGITYQDIEKEGEYEGTFGDKAVVTAVGFRVLESLRVSVGGVAIRKVDPNPLVDHTELAITPFVSFSVDWDVKSSLGKLDGWLGGGT